MMEQSSILPTVISLVGYQGSGKSTIGALVAKQLATEHIEASYVVRAIIGDIKRHEMPGITSELSGQDPYWLAEGIVEVVEEVYQESDPDVAVLTGVREQLTHDYLDERFKLETFEVVAPAAVRYTRLKELGKVSSGKNFIEQDLREKNLGLDEVMKRAYYTIPTSEETSPKGIAKAMIQALKKQGTLS